MQNKLFLCSWNWYTVSEILERLEKSRKILSQDTVPTGGAFTVASGALATQPGWHSSPLAPVAQVAHSHLWGCAARPPMIKLVTLTRTQERPRLTPTCRLSPPPAEGGPFTCGAVTAGGAPGAGAAAGPWQARSGKVAFRRQTRSTAPLLGPGPGVADCKGRREALVCTAPHSQSGAHPPRTLSPHLPKAP